MEAQRYERHVTRINIEAGTAKTRAAIFLAWIRKPSKYTSLQENTICSVAWRVALRFRRHISANPEQRGIKSMLASNGDRLTLRRYGNDA